MSLAQTREGDTFNADQVEATVQALTDEVGRLGYAFVDIQPLLTKRPREPDDRRDLSDQRGSEASMSSGSTSAAIVRTLDEVIRREFRIAEGDAFNTALLRRSQQRLRNLGFFETVDVTTEQGSAPDRS